MNINYKNLANNKTLIKSYLTTTLKKSVNYLFIDNTDSCEECHIFFISKNDVKDSFEAFIHLYNLAIHCYESWDLADITEQARENIVNVWMFDKKDKEWAEYSFDDYSFEPIDSTFCIKQIQQLLSEKSCAVSYNGKSLESFDVNSECLLPVNSAIELYRNVYEECFFYENMNNYIRVDWSIIS